MLTTKLLLNQSKRLYICTVLIRIDLREDDVRDSESYCIMTDVFVTQHSPLMYCVTKTYCFVKKAIVLVLLSLLYNLMFYHSAQCSL